jgi:hypothetical protein
LLSLCSSLIENVWFVPLLSCNHLNEREADMTNLDIQMYAARTAAEHSTFGVQREPADAWHAWSLESGVYDPGARLLFEQQYAVCCQQSLWWQLLSAASGSASWRRLLDLTKR